MKTLMTVFAGLMTAAAFAGVNDVVISFSTAGQDTYADGTVVQDGECYALVWTPEGSTFAGINADGTAAGDSKVAIAAPVAKDGKCPKILFTIDESYANANFNGGTWGVYLLDTRRFKTNEQGVIENDAEGKPIVASVGGKTVNGYGAVVALTGKTCVSGSSAKGVAAGAESAVPETGKNLAVRDIKFIGDNVYLYVSGSKSCMRYELQSGSKPDALEPPSDGQQQYGNDSGDMIIITPKKAEGAFFQVNRK